MFELVPDNTGTNSVGRLRRIWKAPRGRQPVGVALADGRLCIAGIAGLGQTWIQVLGGTCIWAPCGVSVTRCAPGTPGCLLLLDAGARTEWIVDLRRHTFKALAAPALTTPSAVCTLPHGRLAMCDRPSGRVIMLDADGRVLRTIELGPQARPCYMASTGMQVAVSEYGARRLWLYRDRQAGIKGESL